MTNETLIDNPSECIDMVLRNGRTCTECYFSQIHDGEWTGTEACWNAQCIISEQATNATEKLRHILDERGVEWQDGGEGLTIIPIQDATSVAWEVNTWPSSKNTDDCLWIQNSHPLTPEQAITATLGPKITEDTSDGWHTFKDLYHHRALLFSVIVSNYRDLCWKSKRHHDGKLLDWNFIVGIDTPWGQASYHYGMDYWDLFDCKVLERAPYYDGYRADESVARIARLSELAKSTPETCNNKEADTPSLFLCSECGYKNWDTYEGSDSFNFCPNCGRKVVSK